MRTKRMRLLAITAYKLLTKPPQRKLPKRNPSKNRVLSVADPDIPLGVGGGGGGGGHEMTVNAKGIVWNFRGRKLIYNKIITRKI